MYTKLIVVQSIENEGRVKIYEDYSNRGFVWSFETQRSKIDSDPEYFPFYWDVAEIKIRKSTSETKLIIKENEIIFHDTYSLPSGSVINILFPPNYIPDVFKFRDGISIPVGVFGSVINQSPGNFMIRYNYQEKRSAVIFLIHHPITFSFSCIATPVIDDFFPRIESVSGDDYYDLAISRHQIGVTSFLDSDLKVINQAFDGFSNEIQELLKNILLELRASNKPKALGLISKLGVEIKTMIGLGADVLQFTESFKGNDTISKIALDLIKYTAL